MYLSNWFIHCPKYEVKDIRKKKVINVRFQITQIHQNHGSLRLVFHIKKIWKIDCIDYKHGLGFNANLAM